MGTSEVSQEEVVSPLVVAENCTHEGTCWLSCEPEEEKSLAIMRDEYEPVVHAQQSTATCIGDCIRGCVATQTGN